VKAKQQLPTLENIKKLLPLVGPEISTKLCGEQDEYLRLLEKELDIRIAHAAGGISLQGQDSDVALGFDLLSQLAAVIERGAIINKNDVERSLQQLKGNQRFRIEDLFREQIKINGRSRTIVPKTSHQKEYVDMIRQRDMVFGVGPAGTGKTYLAMTMAVAALLNKEVKRIVLCRPAVEAGEKLGFLPGDMAEKVNPYLRPLYDALHDMVDEAKAAEMLEKGQIEVAPLAFMRGRTLADSFCILDEAQNTTAGQMKMFLTRLGQRSKCVVTGDPTQIDLPRGQLSGLIDALHVLRGIPEIGFVQFDETDVVRHQLVSKIVVAYNRRRDGLED
jgi:phosphate starvation-inducible PhoH-like protein